MALIEKLKITDTFKDWRDKINAILDRVQNIVSSDSVTGQFILGDASNVTELLCEVPAKFSDTVAIGDIVINPDEGTISANASSASKLANARTINGTAFDGASNITTKSWGTARKVYISDFDGSNTSASVSVNGSSDITLSLPQNINAIVEECGKFAKPVNINGTAFDGSSAITTSSWGTARQISIADATGQHTSNAVSVNGSGNVTLKLPTAIDASVTSAGKLTTGAKINGKLFTGASDITVEDNSKLSITGGTINGNLTVNGEIHADKVHNAVWNDYAEFFERGEETEVGDIIALDCNAEKEVYVKATDTSTCIVGVHSDSYGFITGGVDSIEESLKSFIPVGIVGRVPVKFTGIARKGMKVIPSAIPGVGREYIPGIDDAEQIIGYLIEADSETGIRKLKMKLR